MCLAIPGQIVEVVDEANRLAKVDVAGVRRNVNIGLLDADGDGVGPGDWVLIHVGFAISQGRRGGGARDAASCSRGWAPTTSRSSRSCKASVIE